MNDSTTSIPADHVLWLDGLRGTAALWVFLSHVQILCGMKLVPVLSWGGLAVDLFMMLSGFLMAHHYLLRERQDAWSSPRTWTKFWTRRFFRIAPLYYFLLVIALFSGPYIGEARNAIAHFWPATATEASRYFDQSLKNFVAHFSFAFGLLPDYAFRTPLPDWSIGLEMQFYLAFPFVMLLIRRWGPLAGGLGLIRVCAAGCWLFKSFVSQFEMPSFLPLKLYVFLIGIWMAIGRSRGSLGSMFVAALFITCAIALRQRTLESFGRVALIAGLFYLMSDGVLPTPVWLVKVITKVRAAFSSPFSRFLGDTSYGFYLVHLLVLIPVAGALTRFPEYTSAPDIVRFTLCVAIAAPISLLLAWILHRTLETNGIRMGKAMLQLAKPRVQLGKI